MPSRVLSEAEFNTLRSHVVAAAPNGLNEADFNRYIGPAMASAIGEAENSPAKVEGSAFARFAAGAWQNLNPVSMAEGLYGAVRHPLDTAAAIGSASLDQGRQAVDLAKQGRYTEAAGHAGAMFPVIGPAAAAAGEAIASGDVAGGLGQATGLLAAVESPRVVRAGAKVVRALPNRLATAADASAAARVTDVMSPKIGPNKTRFGNMAEKAAPTIAQDLANDGAPLSREGLHQRMQQKLHAAEEALDTAHDARFKASSFPTKPLIDDLLEKRKALTSEAVEASHRYPEVDASGPKAVPIGSDVVPSPNAARVAVIDQAIAELKQLGPIARYDPIRTMRMAYDGPAKAIYSPAVTADYMKAQGGKLGAADVTGTLRESLAKWDPKVAEANKGYALYKSATDVLDATAEVERTRPKVGRVIAARVLATVLGEHAAGPAGAAAGYAIAPMIDSALSGGATTKLKTAAALTNLSRAIRSGNVPRVDSSLKQLKRLGITAATVTGSSTSPIGSRTQTTAAAQ